MSVLSSLPIVQDIIPVPVSQLGTFVGGKFSFVVAHSTDNQKDTVDGEDNYEHADWQRAFVHYFCGAKKIIQVGRTQYPAWGAGHTANMRAIHVEAVEGEPFAEVYPNYVSLIAGILYDAGMQVVDGLTLYSHAEVSAKWHESTHSDPIAWLSRGLKIVNQQQAWNHFVQDVQKKWDSYHSPTAVKMSQDFIVSGTDSQGLHVRSSLTSASPVISTLHNNDKVHVDGSFQAEGHGWYHVTNPSGYVWSQYLKPAPKVVEQPLSFRVFVGTTQKGSFAVQANAISLAKQLEAQKQQVVVKQSTDDKVVYSTPVPKTILVKPVPPKPVEQPKRVIIPTPAKTVDVVPTPPQVKIVSTAPTTQPKATDSINVTVSTRDVNEVISDSEQAISFLGKIIALLKKIFHVS